MQIQFRTNQDAIAVYNQLTLDCEVDKNIITFNEPIDMNAIKVAASLKNIEGFERVKGESTDTWKEIEKLAYASDYSIWVGCLAAYNHGYLHGLWISLEQDPEDVNEAIEFMLSWSPVAHLEECEDWDVFDAEGVDVDTDIEYLCSWVELINTYGEAIHAFQDCMGYDDLEELEDAFQYRYHGEYDSEFDFAYQFADDMGLFSNVPESIQRHFDYQSYADELFSTDFVYYGGYVFYDS